MIDLIIILVLLVVVGLAVRYIWKQRKKGIKCIGCPYSKGCSGGCGSGTGTKEERERVQQAVEEWRKNGKQ